MFWLKRSRFQRFVNAIFDRGPADPSALEGLRRTAVLEACYASAAAGHELELDPL
jgi:predicted dehydrogenase